MRFRVCAVAALLLTACSPAPDLDKQLDTVSSWTATLQLATAEHREHAISAIYVSQIEDAAREASADARRSLPEEEHDDRDRRRAGAAVDSLDRAIAVLDAESRR